MTVRNVFWGVSNVASLKEEYPANLYMACVLGENYPTVEGVVYYDFDSSSTAIPDDDEILKPNFSAFDTVGRWHKVDPAVPPQINSDWNSSTGPSNILNKPSLSSVATTGNYTDLTGRPSLATVATSGSYPDLSNKPTIPTQYRLRVQTNSSGVYTWTFPSSFGTGVIPIISCSVEDNSSSSWNHQITSVSSTSVTIQLTKTTPVTILGISVLGISSTPQAYIHLTAVAP